MSLASFQRLVDDLVRDTDQVVSSTQRDDAIENAVTRYSANVPARVVEDVVVDSAGAVPLPAGWIEGESELTQVEHPLGQQPRVYVPLELFLVEQTPSGTVIEQMAGAVAGDTLRLSFTGAHALTTTSDTIPSKHRYAVACLAASDLCGQLAAYYANEGAPTLPADTVDHKGKSERWRARARDLAAEFTRVVGVPQSERARPASVDVAPPRRDSLGRKRFFHPTTDWPNS